MKLVYDDSKDLSEGEIIGIEGINQYQIGMILPKFREEYGYKFAAAPLMYEALKAFDEYVSTNFPANIRLKQIAIERMEQALAKAEGK